MALLTQFASFFISSFAQPGVCDELNKFLRSHRIVNVEKRLIDNDRGTGWLFLVEYGEALKSQQLGGNIRIDYRERLTQQEYALFDKLRELRKAISEKQGVPVYAIFTNEQLATMVKSPPSAIKDLHSYSGVGEGRVKQYGDAFLEFFMNRQVKPVEANK